MQHIQHGDFSLLRLDPGEELIASLTTLAASHERDFYAVISGVGMVANLTFGFFCDANNDYDLTTLTGPFDLNNITGNIARKAGIFTPHIHLTINRRDFSTLSGHLIKAVTHITMELWLHAPAGTGITRITAPGRPASFLSAI